MLANTLGAICLAGSGILVAKYSINPASRILSAGGVVLGIIIAGRQSMDVYHDWKDMRQFTSLLDNLSKYHSLLKRNLIYLTDVSLLNGILLDRERILGQSCIESTLRAVQILHSFVSKLDERQPITRELPNYQPFEDLGSCPAIADHRVEGDAFKHFKEIYTIFLYIQSQFVLRVCIARVDHPLAKTELQDVINHFQSELDRDDLQPIQTHGQNASKCFDLINKRHGGNNELGLLKWTSSNLSTKLMVQLSQLERFNGKLSSVVSSGEVSTLHEDLLALESLFLSNACELENMGILLRKILNNDPQCIVEQENNLSGESSEQTQDPPLLDQNTAITIDDEFFILDGQLAEKHDNATDSQVDDPRNERLLKTCFKSVLRQLRKEIGSLNEDMLARERKFLQQQGVELPLAVANPKPTPLSNGSSTESEDELDDNLVLKKKKPAPRPSKYDENRQFLAEKVNQQGMFRLPLPMSFHTPSEDVLE